MKRLVRLIVVLLGTFVLWQEVRLWGQVTYRSRQVFSDLPSAGLTAEQWCEQVREQLTGHGTFLCLREGVDPATAPRHHQRESWL
jgi:hypothetical protein